MGQKVNPIGFRLGINRTWDSRWFADNAEYGKLLHEDLKIRKFVMDELKNRLCGYRTPGGAPVGGDWSLLLALQGIVDGTDPNRQLTLSQWQEEVLDFTDRVDWDVYRIVREDTPRESPYTLYMTGKKGKQPTIHASRVERQRPSTYLLISVREKDGDIAKLRLRLECGFQPVFLHIETAPKALR